MHWKRRIARLSTLLCVSSSLIGFSNNALASDVPSPKESMSISTWAGCLPDLKFPVPGHGLGVTFEKERKAKVLDVSIMKVTPRGDSLNEGLLASIEGSTLFPKIVSGPMSVTRRVFVGSSTSVINGGSVAAKSQVYVGGGLKVAHSLGSSAMFESEVALMPLALNRAVLSEASSSSYLSSGAFVSNTLSLKVTSSLLFKASAQLDGIGFVDQWVKSRIISDGHIVHDASFLPAAFKSSWKLSSGLTWTF